MNILLINPPIRLSRPAEWVPLGLGYIGAILQKHGHKVEVYDINLTREPIEQVVDNISSKHYDFIGIGGIISVYKYVKKLVPLLKERMPNVPIVVGGSVADTIPDLILNTGVDFGVIGEGEKTILEIVEYVGGSRKLEEVHGIFYRDKNTGKVVYTQAQEVIKDLDSLPFPAWELFDMEKYSAATGGRTHGRKHAMIVASRGCPFNCTYCYRVFGRRARFHSPEYVIEEIDYLKKQYGIRHIKFGDDLFFVNPKVVSQFAELMRQRHPNVTFEALIRVDVVTEELLHDLKSAGCVYISYGFESGSQKLLDTINKRVKVEQALKAIELTRRAKVPFGGTFMFGIPGEDEKTMQETIEFCKKANLNMNVGDMFFITPYPGTALYNYALEQGLIKDLEKFIESLDDATKLLVNFTKYSDEELIELKKKVELTIHKNYLRRNSYIGLFINHIRLYGWRSALRRVIHYLMKKNVRW